MQSNAAAMATYPGITRSCKLPLIKSVRKNPGESTSVSTLLSAVGKWSYSRNNTNDEATGDPHHVHRTAIHLLACLLPECFQDKPLVNPLCNGVVDQFEFV